MKLLLIDFKRIAVDQGYDIESNQYKMKYNNDNHQ